jgi:hypothetical protein
METGDKNDVMLTTGPINFRKFYDQSKYRHIPFVNTCDILPLVNRNGRVAIARECQTRNNNTDIIDDEYHQRMGNYAHTKWIEGSGWGAETLETPTIEEMKTVNKTKRNIMYCCYGIILIALIVFFIFIFYSLSKKN